MLNQLLQVSLRCFAGVGIVGRHGEDLLKSAALFAQGDGALTGLPLLDVLLRDVSREGVDLADRDRHLQFLGYRDELWLGGPSPVLFVTILACDLLDFLYGVKGLLGSRWLSSGHNWLFHDLVHSPLEVFDLLQFISIDVDLWRIRDQIMHASVLLCLVGCVV